MVLVAVLVDWRGEGLPALSSTLREQGWKLGEGEWVGVLGLGEVLVCGGGRRPVYVHSFRPLRVHVFYVGLHVGGEFLPFPLGFSRRSCHLCFLLLWCGRGQPPFGKGGALGGPGSSPGRRRIRPQIQVYCKVSSPRPPPGHSPCSNPPPSHNQTTVPTPP